MAPSREGGKSGMAANPIDPKRHDLTAEEKERLFRQYMDLKGGKWMSPENREKLLRQLLELQTVEGDKLPSSSSDTCRTSFSSRNEGASSPIGMSGRGLSSLDLGSSPRFGMGGGLGSPIGMGVTTYSRSTSRVWWVVGIVVAAIVIAGIWVLVRRFV
jgi:hypothetical protein